MTDHIKTEAPVAAEATPQSAKDSTVDEQITHPLQETLSREGMDSQEHFMDAAEEPQTDIQGNENSTTSLAPTLEQSMTAQTSEAIGPDLPTPTIEIQPQVGTHIQFILLLASAGTRHPFQLSEKYLSKRNVSATGPDGNFDPSVISVYNLKELIFREWRDDWETKPSSPSAIRLIFFGQMLADNTSLKECRILPNGNSNVLHISVKPQELMDDEEAAKTGKTNSRRGREPGSGGCSCVIL